MGIVNKLGKVGVENVAVSAITIAELEFGVAGCKQPEETKIKLYEFLSPFTIIDFDVNAAQYYGKIRNELKEMGQIIGPMDMLIASISLAQKMTLVTNNVKEFARVPELKIENWVNQ